MLESDISVILQRNIFVAGREMGWDWRRKDFQTCLILYNSVRVSFDEIEKLLSANSLSLLLFPSSVYDDFDGFNNLLSMWIFPPYK